MARQIPKSLLLLMLVVVSCLAEPAQEKDAAAVPVVAEDESCGGSAPADEPTINRVIRQVVFPGGSGGSGSQSGSGNVFQGCVCGGGHCSNCVHIARCASAFLGINPQTCQLPEAQLGVCCPDLPTSRPGTGDTRLFTEQRRQVSINPISPEQVNSACQKGITFIRQLETLEQRMLSTNQIVKRETPERGHLKFFKTTATARQAHEQALQINQASRAMMNEFRLSPAQGTHGLRNFGVRNSILANNCPVTPRCNPNAKYRSSDGTCNNLANPNYGRSETAFQRILPPVYDDGVSSPRTRSVAGGALPSERVIASTVLVDRNDPDQKFTTSVMQWAQFLDHDLTHAPFASLPNGEGIECCPNGQEATGDNRHPECWPIRIPPTDRFYAPKGRLCMNFIRSMLGLNQECTFGFAEQMNQLTHWLDASMVYGSTLQEAKALRTGRKGFLQSSNGNLLPFDRESAGDCEARERGRLCFRAGDSRVNEQPGLTAIHTLFMREHNRVAGKLDEVNNAWSDEALYQEARRIVTAQIQHIVFNEWLPIIVGPRFMHSFGISVLHTGYSFDYNPNINPNMNNEFATAAYRFGHSLVQGTISLIDAKGSISTIKLRDHFNSPHLFQETAAVVEMFSRSFSQQAIQKFDPFVTDDLSNHLFQTPSTNFGMDLMSLNLHRGRDHGIAPYNAIREICGLPRARTFRDFNDQIPSDIVVRLQQVYKHVDDVDFFVGGMSEKPVSGGLLGWTFLCVVGDQFARVKKGDRFFYDIGGQPGSFNPAQLNEIRKASWARILCDNSVGLEEVQPLAFQLADNQLNRRQSCQSSAIPRPDLRAWRGERPQA